MATPGCFAGILPSGKGFQDEQIPKIHGDEHVINDHRSVDVEAVLRFLIIILML